ncbi:MAG: polyprenyl diphosphate synthase [Alphaproteobacteria bacterium]
MSTPAKTLQHIAFIMDGNGRWATARGLSRLEGHRQGVEAVRRVCDALMERGVAFATFYAFSTENWKRPEDEVSGLFNLMRLYFKQEMKSMGKKGIRVRFIGDRTPGKLAADIVTLMDEVEATTAANTKLTVQFAINYSGRDELVRAAAKAAKAGEVTAESLTAALDTAGVPDPDLIVRTSGEQRISNFMLWQLAYSELYFTSVAWPDFGVAELDDAVGVFNGRERRFGGLKVG